MRRKRRKRRKKPKSKPVQRARWLICLLSLSLSPIHPIENNCVLFHFSSLKTVFPTNQTTSWSAVSLDFCRVAVDLEFIFAFLFVQHNHAHHHKWSLVEFTAAQQRKANAGSQSGSALLSGHYSKCIELDDGGKFPSQKKIILLPCSGHNSQSLCLFALVQSIVTSLIYDSYCLWCPSPAIYFVTALVSLDCWTHSVVSHLVASPTPLSTVHCYLNSNENSLVYIHVCVRGLNLFEL